MSAAASRVQRSATAGPAAARALSRGHPIYQYPDIVYWWVIWFSAAVCAILTVFQGESVTIGDRSVLVHPSPWLGIVFVALVFLTLTLINLRARGVYAVVLLMGLFICGMAVQYFLGWRNVMDALALVRIHMNLAFYVLVFCISFGLWLYAVLLHPRFIYWFVRAGEVGTRSISGAEQTFKPQNVRVNRHGDDFFVHNILGLKFFGIGTGDIVVDFDTPGHGHEQHVLTNVFHPKRKVELIQKMIIASEKL